MKYRRLTQEELGHFEKEFIEFLVINGITAEDWEEIKEDTSKADGILEAFSDAVFETVLRKASYLEHWSEYSVKVFQCLEDKMVLVGLDTPSPIDPEHFHQALPSGSVYHSTKAYEGSREEELFKMIMQGCTIGDGELFRKMSLLLAST